MGEESGGGLMAAFDTREDGGPPGGGEPDASVSNARTRFFIRLNVSLKVEERIRKHTLACRDGHGARKMD